MKRMVFKDTREITKQEAYVIEKLNQYPNMMNEKLLVSFCSTLDNQLCDRDIREIVGMYNKRKFYNTDNTVKYHKFNGHYHRIVKDSERADMILNKIKFDAIASLKTYKIYLEDFGSFEDDVNAMQIDMLSELIKSMEVE